MTDALISAPALVSFLINRYGSAAFQQFIKSYAESGNLGYSVQQMTGKHLVTLEGEWVDDLKVRVSWVPIVTSATTFWFILTAIFIYSYFRKRRSAGEILMRWEEEEENEPESPDGGKSQREILK